MLKYTTIPAPLGSLAILASHDVLEEIVMTGRRPEEAARWFGKRHPAAEYCPGLLPGLQKQLRDYFGGKPVHFEVTFDLSGLSEFQRRVLEACARLDYGQTVTYGELARRIGKPKASRAVGAALGRNRLPLVIPCHRVVGCGGGLGGFSAEQGVRMKRFLLNLEAGRS